jgi:hypothetical protein
VLIRADADDPITGSFSNLNLSDIEPVGGEPHRYSYAGGTGNDFTLRFPLTVTIGDVTQAEGDSGTTLVAFPITLPRPLSLPLTILYTTEDGTAIAPDDYQAILQEVPGVVTFEPGETVNPATVTVHGDQAAAAAETFLVHISTSGASLDGGSRTTAVGTIENDDNELLDAEGRFVFTSTEDWLEGRRSQTIATYDELQLAPGTSEMFPFVNIAASIRGTLIRIDVRTGEVLGEYNTAPANMGHSPSRTTVDLLGNVWVANRFEQSGDKGSVTRIGVAVGGTRGRKVDQDGHDWVKDVSTGPWSFVPDPGGQYLQGPFKYSTAVDRDGDGLIRTSRGLGHVLDWTNDDGQGNHPDSDGGVETAEDELILNYTRTVGSGTRTVAVDRNNDIWVGGHFDRDHEKISGETGSPVPGTEFNFGAGGYGGLVDGKGVLWSARSGTGLLRFDPALAVTSEVPPISSAIGATVPSQVTIPSGQASVTVALAAQDDAVADGTQTMTITASAAGFPSGSDTVEIVDQTPRITVDIAKPWVAEGAENPGDRETAVTITRSGSTTGDLIVTLDNDRPSQANVPAQATIPDGQTSVTFSLTAQNEAAVDGTQIVTIKASAAGYTSGSDTVDIIDDETPTLTVDIVAASVAETAGTQATQVTIRRNQRTTADVEVLLTSDDARRATVPSRVTIPAGQTSHTVYLAAQDDAIAQGTQAVTIAASATGFQTGSDEVDVIDDETPTLTVDVASAWVFENAGVDATTVTITRSHSDLSGDLVVTLTGDDTSNPRVYNDRGNYGLGLDVTTGHIWHSSWLDTGTGMHKLYELDSDGNIVHEYELTPSTNKFQGLTVDANGHVWVVESGLPADQPQSIWHLAPDPGHPGQHMIVGAITGLYGITGVSVDVDGKIWAPSAGIPRPNPLPPLAVVAYRIDPDGGAVVDPDGDGPACSSEPNAPPCYRRSLQLQRHDGLRLVEQLCPRHLDQYR